MKKIESEKVNGWFERFVKKFDNEVGVLFITMTKILSIYGDVREMLIKYPDVAKKLISIWVDCINDAMSKCQEVVLLNPRVLVDGIKIKEKIDGIITDLKTEEEKAMGKDYSKDELNKELDGDIKTPLKHSPDYYNSYKKYSKLQDKIYSLERRIEDEKDLEIKSYLKSKKMDLEEEKDQAWEDHWNIKNSEKKEAVEDLIDDPGNYEQDKI